MLCCVVLCPVPRSLEVAMQPNGQRDGWQLVSSATADYVQLPAGAAAEEVEFGSFLGAGSYGRWVGGAVRIGACGKQASAGCCLVGVSCLHTRLPVSAVSCGCLSEQHLAPANTRTHNMPTPVALLLCMNLTLAYTQGVSCALGWQRCGMQSHHA